MALVIESLVASAELRERLLNELPRIGGLDEGDALIESQLVDVRVHTLKSVAALLFDMRMALAEGHGNVALIVFENLERFDWTQERRGMTRTAWTLGAFRPERVSGTLTLRLDLYPHGRLLIVAGRATLYEGDVQGLPDTPPDFVCDDEAYIESGTPQWDSEMTVKALATFDREE